MPPLVPRLKRFLKGSKNADKNTNEETVLNRAKSFIKPKAEPLVTPETTTEPPSAEIKSDQQTHVDPWTRAFEIFQERNNDNDLLTIYKTHLRSFHGPSSDHDSSILDQSSVKGTVDKFLKERENRQWKVSIGSNDVKIRSQFEKLAKFLLWSDGFVKTAVSTQPYAALAWSGVSLILQVSNSRTRDSLRSHS